jgi:flagellar hook assembly protein FlgD
VYIYDISGDLVWTGQNTAGSASLTWKVVNSAGNQLVPGVYLYVVTTASGGKQSGKIAIVR